MRLQLGELAKRQDENERLTLERLCFVSRQVTFLRRLVVVLGCALLGLFLGLMLSGCSGQAFEAAQGRELGEQPRAGAPGGAGMTAVAGGGAMGIAPELEQGGAGGEPELEQGGAGGEPELDQGGAGGALELEPTPHACDRLGWQATAWASFVDSYGGPAQLALDGSDQTRWTGGAAQQPGQWFAVQLPRALDLVRVRVSAVQVPTDAPEQLALELDGQMVPAMVLRPAVGQVVLELDRPRVATRLRLVLLAAVSSWWSIDELTADCR